MEEVTPIGSRKNDHLHINLQQDVSSGLTTGLEEYHFVHCALPEINLSEIDLGVNLFGKHLSAPLLISSMTGGTAEAGQINQILASAAEQAQIAMGVGSQRIAIDHPELAHTFQIRRQAPTALIFANLGAIQLNYGYGLTECQRAVDMVQADALVLHLNALQEALQPEGQSNFAGLLNKIETICHALPVPVIAKEVGWGFSKQDVSLLAQAGITAIDVAGSGGTSWSQVEMHRAETEEQRKLAAAFHGWGTPTSDAILNVILTAPGVKVIASGGLRSGMDIAKCIALGASIGGLAGPFLKAAARSLEETLALIDLLKQEIRVCMFATGSLTLDQLRHEKLVGK
ncbi:MAG: type 2 isopentenyl-diphosphate Delta-isomerase [Anaerolineales bacterium]|nr:type 2 isopentenyl-diphosphate Delta-isomerase [Anaerolineae bacterium]PWB50959.1 MAG: type 2 isopentenyl-diphosphate Delta-isomerase [Anaerolineales bacterium]